MKLTYPIVLVFLLSCTLEVKAQQTQESTHQPDKREVRPRLFGKLYLGQNYPNPVKAHQSTTIPFRSITVDDAKIIVFNSDGDSVIVFNELVGKKSITIEGRELLPGNYEYCLFVSGRIIRRKKLQVAPEG